MFIQREVDFRDQIQQFVGVHFFRSHLAQNAPFVGSLTGEEGLIALIGNSFATMLLDRDMRAQDLEVLSRLAMHVPLRSLEPSDDLRHLSRLCDVILEDFRSLDTPVSCGPVANSSLAGTVNA